VSLVPPPNSWLENTLCILSASTPPLLHGCKLHCWLYLHHVIWHQCTFSLHIIFYLCFSLCSCQNAHFFG
jgi:hypothetical protein